MRRPPPPSSRTHWAYQSSNAGLTQQERILPELTDQLATKETEFATTGAELDRFRLHYLRRFAPLYAELDRLEAEVASRVTVRDGRLAWAASMSGETQLLGC